ncbi:HEPN domain-containing protein [Mucilaginibacter sp. ZT4R22]|uniref:HEPN domain-containing protein n=1 Tax=Mucilaginibacter pankratovii TaxID=2772110 RepID=A0ABR7WQG3_9SPHI|nr:HEPN domain-containing protein [Mucilaginibacter pankratovii]MBD1364561.1 HEPN domain-containing protein [Mucilaginibacter pankratovii]
MNVINFSGGRLVLNISGMDTDGPAVSRVSLGSDNLTETLYKRLLQAEREKVQTLKDAIDQKYPLEEIVSDYYMTEEQSKEMSELIEFLAHKYDLTHIYCFARKGTITDNFSKFGEFPSSIDLHFFFLFITKANERVEHEIQEYINTHYKSFKVTAISHGLDSVCSAVAQGNRFFIEACLGGLEMYHDKVNHLDVEFPTLNPSNTLQKAEKHFHDHIKMSTGFLYSAANCIRLEEYPENGVFMLHQAMEQACIALIKVHMGYRTDLHNLTRLLNLCKCFSDKPAELFLAEDEESVSLFKVLRQSYGDTRYADDFRVDKDIAIKILERVDAFVSLAESLCLDWINALRTKIGEDAAQNVYSVKEERD